MSDEPLALPERQLGMVAPLLVTREIAYQFYRLQFEATGGWTVALAEATMDLRGFTQDALREADSERLDRAVAGLVSKGAEYLILGGVPVVALRGFQYWRERLDGLGDEHDVPFVSDFECALEGLKALGAQRIVIGNKWDDAINRQLKADVEGYSDIEVLGIGSDLHSAADISSMRTDDGARSCREACERALRSTTETPDAIFLAGGAWYSTLVTSALEGELGLPIVTNPGASMWYALNRVGCYGPAPAFGRLYELVMAESA